jgi:hypothetical protein
MCAALSMLLTSQLNNMYLVTFLKNESEMMDYNLYE